MAEEPDLRDRVAAHGLIEKLLALWDDGVIHADRVSGRVIIDDQATSWYRGVLGERRMAHELALLGDGWTVLHSVPVGDGSTDIDHVAIGPGGVFTINTKYSPGKTVWVAGGNLRVDRFPQPYIVKANAEARRAAARLSEVVGPVEVTPVLAFIDPARVTIKEAPHHTRVVAGHDVHHVLGERVALSREEIERIVDVARLPSTWHDDPAPTPSGRHLEREFAALELELGPTLAAPYSAPRTPAATVLVSAPAPIRYKRPARTTIRSPRPQPRAASRRPTRNRGRRKRSLLDRLLFEFAMPIAGLFVAWHFFSAYINNLTP